MSDAATTSVSPLVLARAAAEAVLGVDGVAGLDGGSVGEYATYGAGERQAGVRAVVGGRPRVGVRVVAVYGSPLPDLVDEVRQRVRTVAAGLLGPGADRPVVDVHVVDVVAAAPPSALPSAGGGTAAAGVTPVAPVTTVSDFS